MSKKKNDFAGKTKKVFADVGEIGHNLGQRIVRKDAKNGVKDTGRTLSRVLGYAAKAVLTIVLVLLTTGVILSLFGAVYVKYHLEVDTSLVLEKFNPNLSSHFFAMDESTGQWVEVETISGKENRIWADYDDIPEYVKNAAVAIEDKRFWEHQGVDWKRTIGAFVNMFLGMKDTFGGSTITQQLIKNETQNDEVTVQRKLGEIFQALEFERRTEKKDILEAYLNYIFLGEGCNGVKTAAKTYFNKELADLTLAESACLIGITNNPYQFNPYTNPKKNKERQTVILKEMRNQELITEAEYRQALGQELVFARSTPERETKIRSWYVDQVIVDLTDDLMSKYGWSKLIAQQHIFSSGYNIYMNVDQRLQGIMDEIWMDPEYWPEPVDDELPLGAMMIVDQHDGRILAMSGSRTEKTGNLLHNYATKTVRQPGSSIKPVAVYAPAFDLGLINPLTVFDDAPVKLEAGKAWPKNSPVGYDGRTTVLTGVTKSKNTVSVRTMELLTPERSFVFARDNMGLSTLIDNEVIGGKSYTDIGYPQLALGALTNGVSVRDMASAYTAFANDGVRLSCTTYSKVTDAEGNVVIDNEPEAVVAMKEKTAYYVTACLQNAVSYGTGSAAKLKNIPTAGKTGTTSKNFDRWFAGYTPYYVGVCWFGYEQPRSLSSYSGNPALNLWKKVMDRAHEGLEGGEFSPAPFDSVKPRICLDSGLIATEACELDPRGSRVTTAIMAMEDVPTSSCKVHVSVNIDTASGYLATPYCPAETLKRVSLLNVVRPMPAAGVVIADEQYTLRFWEYDVYGNLGEEQFKPLPALSKNATHAYNEFCPLHSAAPPPDTNTPPPDDNPSAPPDDGSSPPPSAPPDGDDWYNPEMPP